MGKIIDADNLNEHQVKKFEFAALDTLEEKVVFNPKNLSQEETIQKEVSQEKKREKTPDINALLQKIDTLTEENITHSMNLETLEKKFEEKLKIATEEAYQKGKEEGVKDTQETLQEHNDDLNIQLVKSITLLEEQLQIHDTFIASLKDELTEVSIIIAKKIIKKELEENSHKVALTLANSFIKDLKEANTITLKVNPKDAHYIEEHFKEQKSIMIDADDAINKGGIIILSDIGNIDGSINTRIEKAIALIKREG